MKTLLLSTLLLAARLPAEPVKLAATALFHGTSTLHDFEGSGVSAPCEAEWRPTPEGGVLNAKGIRFDVSSLTTNHKKRDRNMMNMFKPGTFPAITGDVKSWSLGGDAEAERILEIHLHGQTVKVPVTLLSYKAEEDGVRFRCRFDLSLEECGLKRPSVLGLIRVGDTVTVEVESVFRKPE